MTCPLHSVGILVVEIEQCGELQFVPGNASNSPGIVRYTFDTRFETENGFTDSQENCFNFN